MGWCLVLVVPMVGATVLAACGIRKPPTPCDWTGQRPSASLIEDVKLAEDLAIRHVDAMYYGAGAVRAEARERCEATLFAPISNARGISVDAVRDARGQLDRRGFDWLVNLPMAGFTIATALVMLRMVRKRFPDDRLPRVVAIVLLSVGLGALVIGVGQVWAFSVEAIRIGNDHLGHRGLRIPWGTHRSETFVLAVLGMWVIAALSAPGTHIRHPRHPQHPQHPGTTP